ncbi:MAG: hypothetical protein H0X26_01255 [Alphaproteobacteria bacterium]|nr:hypothetical protein [Alphaproteobacteria bacterium]
MKQMLFLATTFLTITSPVFGMVDDKESQTRTITIVADLDQSKSQRVSPGTMGNRDWFSMPGHFSWNGMPEGYQYDFKDHRVTFKISSSPSPQMYEFSTCYTPEAQFGSEKETWYTHSFFAEIAGGHEDNTVQATLLKIEQEIPSFERGACSSPKICRQIYKR